MTEAATKLHPVPKHDGPANVIEAIHAVMRDLPGIGKGEKSPQGYFYRGIEAITAEAQQLFGRYGLTFVPAVKSREVADIVVNGKPWTDTILEVEYTVYGPGGIDDRLRVGPLWGVGRDNSDKGTNKAMTQVFKYALLQVFAIGDAKDDGDNHTAEADARPAPPRLPEGMVSAGKAKKDLVAWFQASGLEEGSAKEAAKAAWGERGSEPISQADLESLIASLAGDPEPQTYNYDEGPL